MYKCPPNIFVDVFSMINKLYSLEDYMWLDNIPESIFNFYYISSNREISGRYLTFRSNYINFYIIKDTNDNSFIDTMIINNEEYVIIVVPFNDYDCRSYINSDQEYNEEDYSKLDIVYSIYNYIFKYLSLKIRPIRNSSLDKLLYNADIVLTILSESCIGCYNRGMILKYLSSKYKRKDLEISNINEILEYNAKALFVDGALLAILKQNKATEK